MRVAVEADECGLRCKVGLGFRVVVDVVEFGWLIERGVRESDGIDIGCDRLRPQPGFLGFAQLLVGELKRLADRDVPVLVCDFIGNGKHGFMVAENGDGTGIHDALHTHGRFWAVAYGVAETEHSLHGKLVDVGKHGGEGIDICMHIAEDGEEGGLGFRHGIFLMDLPQRTQSTRRVGKRRKGDANPLSWMTTNAPVSFSSSVISVSSVVNFSVLGC